ncbi:MAG: hypothetical protein AB1304_01275 [Bacteroidota bacterium]
MKNSTKYTYNIIVRLIFSLNKILQGFSFANQHPLMNRHQWINIMPTCTSIFNIKCFNIQLLLYPVGTSQARG